MVEGQLFPLTVAWVEEFLGRLGGPQVCIPNLALLILLNTNGGGTLSVQWTRTV